MYARKCSDIGLVQKLKVLISVHAQEEMSLNATVVERKACCCVVKAFFYSRLELIRPIASLKISKMCKIHFWHRALGGNGLTTFPKTAASFTLFVFME